MFGETIRYTWATGPELAWGLVRLTGGRDGDKLAHLVYGTRDAALAGAHRAGPVLYRVTGEIGPADEHTPAPVGRPYAFVCSSATEYTIWTKPNVTESGGSQYDGVWAFDKAADAIERTEWANKSNDRYEGRYEDGPRFGTYLVTWEIAEEES